MTPQKETRLTYDEMVESFLNKRREELKNRPRELLEQSFKEAAKSTSERQVKAIQRRRHKEPDPTLLISKLKQEYPFIGIMIHEHKYPR